MTISQQTLIQFDDSTSEWERVLYAFLAEKHRRSGSDRTVQSYARMLRDCFGRLGKGPDVLTQQEVFAWAHGVGLSGREPAATTINARIACLSSFYRFLIRMGMLTTNPCEPLERPRIHPAPPRGLNAEQIRGLLSVIPDSAAGRRDRALILMFAFTGRRRSEVLRLTGGDIAVSDGVPYYVYRGKGGKRGRRELPRPVYEAIETMLAERGSTLASLCSDAPLWEISDSAFYARFRRYLAAAGLPLSGLHVLRHSAAKLRRDAGVSVESVSAWLDHSSVATTSIYLRRLEGERDETWGHVAEAISA